MQARKKSKAKQTPASSTTATKPKAAKAKTAVATEAQFDNPLNADEFFDAADADGDGVVTKQEVRDALARQTAANPSELERNAEPAPELE